MRTFGKKRLITLAVTMIATSAITSITIGYLLFKTSIDVQFRHLQMVTASVSQIIQMDAQKHSSKKKWLDEKTNFSDILDRVESHLDLKAELVVAHVAGSDIEFLSNLNQGIYRQRAPYIEEGAQPMKLAVAGKSGYILGTDYNGIRVYAAYEFIPDLEIGVVAKIDAAHVQAPFVQAAWYGLLMFVVFAIPSLCFLYHQHAKSMKSILASQQQSKTYMLNIVEALARLLDKRDPYTSGHQRNVSRLSVEIGSRMGMNNKAIEELKLGAMIHDIGKVNLPYEILNRPGKISSEEFQVIKQHPKTGYDIINNLSLPIGIKEVIIGHHERINGDGYPYGLKGDELTLSQKIVAVADVVEAAQSHRPYRPARDIHEALEIITQGSGTLFDKSVVEHCVEVLESGFEFTKPL